MAGKEHFMYEKRQGGSREVLKMHYIMHKKERCSSKRNDAMIYESKDYFIVRTSKGYDIRHKLSTRHSHNIKSLKIAKKIIHNVERNTKPHTKDKYLLETYHRLATDERYMELIERLQGKRNLTVKNNL